MGPSLLVSLEYKERFEEIKEWIVSPKDKPFVYLTYKCDIICFNTFLPSTSNLKRLIVI